MHFQYTTFFLSTPKFEFVIPCTDEPSGSANYHTEPEGSVPHAELNYFIFHLSSMTDHAHFIFVH